jgi:hypothetical protein
MTTTSRRRAEPLRAEEPGWSGVILRPLLVYAVSRVVVLAGVVAAVRRHGGLGLVEALGAWDGRWYTELATNGYPTVVPREFTRADPIAFFPLFPMLMRGLAAATGLSELAAGAALATVFGAVATVLLWRFVERLSDQATADRAAALFAFFPASFVLSLAYAEGLALVFAIACLWALLERRWVIAGVAAALATATRPNMAVLGLCCAWAAVGAYRERRELEAFAAPALAPVGMLAFFGYLWAHTGEPLAWLMAQRYGWGERFDFGYHAMLEVVILALGRQTTDWGSVANVSALAFALGAGLLMWRWRPPAELVIYAVGVVVMAGMSQSLHTRPRFVMTAFPLIVAVAVSLRGWWFALALAVSTTLLAVMTVVCVSGIPTVVP